MALQSQLLASGLDVSALNLIKYSQQRDSRPALAAAFIAGGSAYLALSDSIRETTLTTSNVNWNVISSILGVITGVIVWQEDISDRAKLGIALGLVSLFLIDGNK